VGILFDITARKQAEQELPERGNCTSPKAAALGISTTMLSRGRSIGMRVRELWGTGPVEAITYAFLAGLSDDRAASNRGRGAWTRAGPTTPVRIRHRATKHTPHCGDR
jgi:hypothetical protein